MKPLPEEVPRLLVIQIQIQAVWLTELFVVNWLISNLIFVKTPNENTPLPIKDYPLRFSPSSNTKFLK